MRFGIQIGNYFGFDYKTIEKIALNAEKVGFDSIWISDHFFFDKSPETRNCLEAWTVLAALASKTHSLRLGTLVTCNSFRYPTVLAKMAATVDVISNGRLEFGIGAGWKENEHIAYGIPFPSVVERLERLEESIQIIKKLWTDPRATFKGKYYTVKDAYSTPKPVQKLPPIFIGGHGRRRTLRIVAEYGDYCNFLYEASLEEITELLDVLKMHCKTVSRDYDSVGKSYLAYVLIGETRHELEQLMTRMAKARNISVDKFKKRLRSFNSFSGTPDTIQTRFQELIDLGFDYFQIEFPYREDYNQSEAFANLVLNKLK